MLVGKKVSSLPMQDTEEMRIRSLGREDPLEEGTATHSNILALDRGACRAAVRGVTKSRT